MGKQAAHIHRHERLSVKPKLTEDSKKLSVGSFLQALASISGLLAALLTLCGYLYFVGFMQELQIPVDLFTWSAQYLLLTGYLVVMLNFVDVFDIMMSERGQLRLLFILALIALYVAILFEAQRRKQERLSKGLVVIRIPSLKRLLASRYSSLLFGVLTFGSLYLLIPALIFLLVFVLVLPMPAYYYGQKEARTRIAPGECIKPPSTIPKPHCAVLTAKNDEQLIGIILAQNERWTAIRSSGKTIVVPSEFKRIEQVQNPDSRSASSRDGNQK